MSRLNEPLQERVNSPQLRPRRHPEGRTLWRMKRALPLLALTLLSVASGQDSPPPQFGRSLRLPEGAYERTRTARLLNLPLPREGVRLRSLTPVGAAYLKAVFTDAPARFGYRCTGEQELTLLPGTAADARAFGAQLLGRAGTQPLSQSAREMLLSAGGNVFASFSQYDGVLYFSACQAARDFTALKTITAHLEAHVGGTPYVVTGDLAGRLTWCTGARVPWRTLPAFTGSLLTLDVSQDGTRVAAGGWDAQPVVKVYDAPSGALVQTLRLKDGPLALTFSGDARTLLVLDGNQTYTWFDIASGRALNSWSTPSLLIPNLLGGGDRLFLEWTATGPLRVYDAQKGRPAFSLRNFNLSDRTFTPDGQWLVTSNKNGVLSAFSSRDGQPGPSTTLGVVAGAGLMPGQSGPEVVTLLRQTAEGRPSRIVTSAWRVGESTLTPRGMTEHRNANAIVMNQARVTPASLPLCRAQ